MITTIIVFIVVLGILVFVHELGHFTMAKIFGVGVEEFGFGFPPRLYGLKKGKTIYSLNWIPIGGFVKIKGVVGGDQADELDKKNKSDKDNFINKPIWQRFAILFAGVFMNFILCGLLYSIGFMIGLPASLDGLPNSAVVANQKILIMEAVPDSPAAKAELIQGDAIVSVNDAKFQTIADLKKYLASYDNQEVKINIERTNQIIEKNILVTRTIANDNEPGIGVYLTESGTVSFPWYEAIYRGFKHTVILVGLIFKSLYDIVSNLFVGKSAGADFSGPIGIAVLTNQVTKMGFIYILQFAALLSINLAIFNLLPLPALDGGRLLFLIIEKIRGKSVNQKIENMVHNIGFAFLLLLILLVTFKDISKYQIINHLKNIFS